jgi:ribosomal protein L3
MFCLVAVGQVADLSAGKERLVYEKFFEICASLREEEIVCFAAFCCGVGFQGSFKRHSTCVFS